MSDFKSAALQLSVNSSSSNINTNITFFTQDYGSAKLQFSIFKDTIPLNLTGATAKLTFVMADKSAFQVDATIDNVENGSVSYVLMSDILQHFGRASAELNIYFDNNAKGLSVGQFSFTINQSLSDQKNKPAQEFYIESIEALKADVSQAQTDIQTVQDLITQNQVVLQTDYNTFKDSTTTQLAEIMSQSGISAVDVTKPPNGLTKAKGDGVTDDTATIQAILDYVGQNGGGTVFFPKGTYMINAISTSTVTGGLKVNYDNMELILSPNATIKVIPNGSDKYDTVTFYNMKNGRISGGKLEGDRLTHNYSSGGTHELGFGVKTDRAENIIIENMLITNFTGDCIITYGANNGVTGYIPSKNIKILNNTLDMSRRNNISVVLGQDILIHGNVITNAGQSDGVNAGCAPMAGIDVEGGSNPWRVKISNNIFKKNLGGSIILFNGNEIIVDGNISDNFIDFQLSSNVLISNNELRNLGDTTHTAIEQTVSGAQSPQGSGVMLAIGAKYIINSRVTLDFTTIGAPDNNAGTVFVATGAGPLGTGDSVTRQLENISITNNQIVGFAGGISVSDTTKNSVIANNVLKAQTTTGIYAKGNVDVIGNSLNEQSIAIRCDGVDLNIKDNVIDNVTNRAIYCIGSASTGEIQNNLITNFKHTINGAIDISAGTWAVIGNVLDCGIVGPPNYAISNSSAGTKISGNTVIGGTFGLAVIRLIQKASVIGNRILGSNAPYGIYSTTTNASNSIVSRNYVEMTSTTGSRYGIFFSGGGTGVKVVNNEVHNASSVLTNSINTDANTTSLIARNLTTSGTILADATDTVTENLSY